jgi:hypothetical protein
MVFYSLIVHRHWSIVNGQIIAKRGFAACKRGVRVLLDFRRVEGREEGTSKK